MGPPPVPQTPVEEHTMDTMMEVIRAMQQKLDDWHSDIGRKLHGLEAEAKLWRGRGGEGVSMTPNIQHHHNDKPWLNMRDFDLVSLTCEEKDTKEAWRVWSFKMLNFVESQVPEMAKALTEIERRKDEVKIDDDAIIHIPSLEKWNAQLWSVIVNKVGGSALKKVQLVEGKNSFEAWRALRERCNPSSVEAGPKNYQALLMIKDGTMDKLQERIDEMERIAQNHFRDTGRQMDEDLMKGKLLNMLTGEMRDKLTIEGVQDKANYMTLRARIYAIANHNRHVKKEVNNIAEEGVGLEEGREELYVLKGTGKGKGPPNWGKGKGDGKGNYFQGYCYDCGQYGHKGAHCPSRQWRPKGGKQGVKGEWSAGGWKAGGDKGKGKGNKGKGMFNFGEVSGKGNWSQEPAPLMHMNTTNMPYADGDINYNYWDQQGWQNHDCGNMHYLGDNFGDQEEKFFCSLETVDQNNQKEIKNNPSSTSNYGHNDWITIKNKSNKSQKEIKAERKRRWENLNKNSFDPLKDELNNIDDEDLCMDELKYIKGETIKEQQFEHIQSTNIRPPGLEVTTELGLFERSDKGVNGFEQAPMEEQEDAKENAWHPLPKPIVIDSGAAVSVLPSNWCRQYRTRSTEAVGTEYSTANGGSVTNEGEKVITVLTKEGRVRSMTFQVAKVSKALASVGAICDKGNRVVFEASGGYIESTVDGTRTKIRRQGGVYVLDVEVASQGASTGTNNQAGGGYWRKEHVSTVFSRQAR